MTTPTRQAVGFPTVATIRKGTPKRKMEKNYNGTKKTVEILGLDLKNKFRIDFLPGTQKARDSWHALHIKDYVKYPDNFVVRDGYEVETIRAMLMTPTVWESWQWQNETYDASGRRIAIADGDHYIMKKDPLTGEKIINNGEPYKPFNVGDAITYERNGQTVGLAMRSIGRLKLFLPELGQAVSFLLRTSSYIDSLYINEHLAAIQAVADMLNHGIAGGIPLDIYRVERDSPWQKDGQSHKGKQWFIHIEANSEWMLSAARRMKGLAMGETFAGLLQPVNVDMSNLPEQVSHEADDEAEPGAIEEIDDSKVIPLSFVDEPDIPPMTYKEAADVIVTTKNGADKVMSMLSVDQLNRVFLHSPEPRQKEAAKIVLKHDFDMEPATE